MRTLENQIDILEEIIHIDRDDWPIVWYVAIAHWQYSSSLTYYCQRLLV